MDVISIIMAAGKSSVDVALYTLLPIMVIMLIIMKYLEVRGILDVIVRWEQAPAYAADFLSNNIHGRTLVNIGQ